MKFAIIDDDSVFADYLNSELDRICEQNGIKKEVEIFTNPKEVINEDLIRNFDVILLDIEMPQMSGLEIAERLNSLRRIHVSPYIIFVTSQDHLVFQALKRFPYAFVRKSCMEDLECALIHIKGMLVDSITVKMGRTSVFIKLNELIYIEKQGNYVDFHAVHGVYQERTTIDEKLKRLASNGFLKVHSGAAVNAAHIIEFSAEQVRMSDGTLIPVSRAYRQKLREDFREWMVKM